MRRCSRKTALLPPRGGSGCVGLGRSHSQAEGVYVLGLHDLAEDRQAGGIAYPTVNQSTAPTGTVEHFESIDAVLDRIRTDIPWNPFLSDSKIAYEWVADGSAGRLVPSLASPFWSPFLYRGQAQRHSPCIPGVFRGLQFVDHPQKLTRRERARCFLARIQLEEFLLALGDHPAVAYARDIGLKMSREALAQHYEMATDRLDLSQDPEVAGFFATNERAADGHWVPVNGGTGVLYRLDISGRYRSLQSGELEWIGKQVLPRPGEQKGWTLLMPLGGDFENLPVDVFTFEQRKESGQRINEKFGGSEWLFPPDVLAEVAQAIRDSKSVARSLIGRVLALQGCRGDFHRRELDASVGVFAKEFGIAVDDREPLSLSPRQRADAEAQTQRMKETFLDDVGVRAVRRV